MNNIIKSIKSFFKSKKELQNTFTYYTRCFKYKPYKSNIGNGNCIQILLCRKEDAFFKITTHSMYATIENLYENEDVQVVKQPYSLNIRY